MGILQAAVLRPINTRAIDMSKALCAYGFGLAVSILSAVTALPSYAQNYSQPVAFEVKNDRGGLLRKRISQLSALRQSNQPIRITGSICYSTCTMFIGLPQTCISPNTTFGFHGPSSFGRALDPATFNTASRIIARDYPPALKEWYMTKGRYKINSIYRIKGSQIIDMGVKAC